MTTSLHVLLDPLFTVVLPCGVVENAVLTVLLQKLYIFKII